jgi:5'-nucleotidase
MDEIDYESFVDIGRRLANELKNEHNCDIVIALTHMRWENDNILADKVPEIDLFLGGHDHDFKINQINDRVIVKSGSDFRELSYIELDFEGPSQLKVNRITKITVNSKIEENDKISKIVDSYLGDISDCLNVVLGHINCDLDGRFAKIRTEETNLGNFICDIMLEAVNADCALVNSGSLRSDCIHGAGEFKVKDLRKIIPFLDDCVVLSMSGNDLLETLLNGVSQYPKHEGRFLQVAGVKFAFDPSKEPHKRIDPKLVKVQGEPLNLEQTYTVITKHYLKLGKDGFDALINCPVVVDDEDSPILYNIVENHFKQVKQILKEREENKDKLSSLGRFRASIVPLFTVNKILKQLSVQSGHDKETTNLNDVTMTFSNAAFLVSKVLSHKNRALTRQERKQIKQSDSYKNEIKVHEEKAIALNPQIEGRIICIKDNQVTLFDYKLFFNILL